MQIRSKDVFVIHCFTPFNYIIHSKHKKSIKKAKKFETEYNKLTYDTEIENIYLVGNFCVEHNGRVEQLERQAKRYYGNFTLSSPLLNSMVNAVDIAENGMPFFAGKIKIQKKFSLTAEECSKCKYLRFKHIGVNSYRIKINGIEAGFLYTGQFAVSVENMLVEGENVLEIEMSVSLRNMLGPHHLEEGEAYMVLTTSWQKLWALQLLKFTTALKHGHT